MKLGYLVGLAVVGVVLSATLGACSGVSDLGEPVGDGGETGTGGDTAMGGSTAVGGGPTMTGGSTSVGGGPTMTGGSTSVGGTSTMTGGVGGGPTMTGGSTSVGGTSTMTGGSTSVGGGPIMTGGVGGSMMPEVGGSGGVGTECETTDECPQPPPSCQMCLNGVSACYGATCNMGFCGIQLPECPENVPCEGKTCGDTCFFDGSGPTPGGMGAGGSSMMGAALPQACDASGRCVTVDGDGWNLGCMDPGEIVCMGAMNCPEVEPGTCTTCDDGSTACPRMACENGRCKAHEATCDAPQSCDYGWECPILPDICIPCGDGSCAAYGCIDGGCELICQIDRACETSMNCPPDAGNACNRGEFECVEGVCSIRQQACLVSD